MALEIKISNLEAKPNVKMVKLKGELDVLSGKNLRQEVLPVIENNNICLIIDCADLTYINSNGIYELLCCYTKAKEKGGSLRLIAVNKRIWEILDVVGISKIIPGYENLETALRDIEAI